MLSHVNKKYFKLAVGFDRLGRETDVDIAARCPVCGDSKTHKNKKRLHLYSKNGLELVHCFNGDCAAHNKTMYSFLRDFFPALLAQYKRENFGTTLEKIANGDVFEQLKTQRTQSTDDSEPKVEDKPEVLVHDLSSYMTPVESHQPALDYLSRRGYTYNEANYGKWYYGHQDLKIGETLYRITGAVVIPLYYNGQMYGFYSRNIENKTFYTYMHDANIGYKIAFWFNIDKDKPVYIYEGIFDAIAGGLKNSIALMGGKIPDERLAELKEPVFVLDNDRTGLVNSLSYAKRGYAVYIQPDKYPEKDMNDLKLRNPDLNLQELITKNIFRGISAEVRIKGKL